MKKSVWEVAILNILEKHKGVATLKNFYEEIPQHISQTKSKDLKHSIRAYLRRLKSVKKHIKQIGLSTYALIDVKPKNFVYADIVNPDYQIDFFNLPRNEIHGYVEGMLIEIGNLKEYDTYTPDGNVIFNGERLSDLVTCKHIPQFTYSEVLNVIKQIDVVWFKDRFPYCTFDVEFSTQISLALVRANELKNFKTNSYIVADKSKKNLFNGKINAATFKEIKNSIKFITIKSVFEDYRNFVLENMNKERSLIFR